MPDESCRSCGGELAIHSRCHECKKAIQKACGICNALTRKQFHNQCNSLKPVSNMPRRLESIPTMSKRQEPHANMHRPRPITNAQARQVVQLTQNEAPKKSRSVRSTVLLSGVIGFFLLGFVIAAYFDPFDSEQSSTLVMESNNIPQNPIQHAEAVPTNALPNCLAYGSGESVTVTCPTQYGYVYKAILAMPKELAGMFSDSVFSIRGVSVTENSDGTVILQYQNNIFKTNFFAN